MQSARGIDDQDVEVAGLRFFAGVMGDAGRIAALRVLDDLAAEPFAPDGELGDGGGAEGVAGGDHHFLAFVLAIFGELGDGGRLAGAVDAGDHDDGGPARGELIPGRRGQQRLELVLDERVHLAGDFLVLVGLLDAADDFLRREGADVRQIERLFQIVEEFLIDLALAGEKLRDAAEEVASWREPL